MSDRTKTSSNSVLLVGAQGQVGQELAKALAPLSEVLGPVTAVGRSELDLTDLEAIAQKVATVRPTLIINAAAYTAVDKAETEPNLAHLINTAAPKTLATSAASCGATLVHISTDYVFDGAAGSPYRETDATSPASVYGKTKLAGEEAIRQALDEHIILRTAWVYGTQGKGNFLKTMLRLGESREALSVVEDQIGSPTWAKDIAQTIGELSTKLVGTKLVQQTDQPQAQTSDQITELAGTYHFTNSGVASWYDFAVAIFEEAKALGIPLQIQTVTPITTADYPTPAKRPAYSVLNCQKIARTLGHPSPHWRTSLRAMLKEFTA